MSNNGELVICHLRTDVTTLRPRPTGKLHPGGGGMHHSHRGRHDERSGFLDVRAHQTSPTSMELRDPQPGRGRYNRRAVLGAADGATGGRLELVARWRHMSTTGFRGDSVLRSQHAHDDVRVRRALPVRMEADETPRGLLACGDAVVACKYLAARSSGRSLSGHGLGKVGLRSESAPVRLRSLQERVAYEFHVRRALRDSVSLDSGAVRLHLDPSQLPTTTAWVRRDHGTGEEPERSRRDVRG